jgi:hypothetical protein
MLSENEIKQLTLRNSGSELSRLILKPQLGDKPADAGRHEFQGRLERAEPGALILWDAKGGQSLILDFSWTSGLDLSVLPANRDVSGAWGVLPTMAGNVQGVVLKDERGLLFAAETQLSQRVLKDQDLPIFTFHQKRDELGEPVGEADCARVYFPDVAVSAGKQKTVVIPHGAKRVIRHGGAAYLVSIVRSRYNEEIPCGVALERTPWELEYVLRRLDNPMEIQQWESLGRGEKPGSQHSQDSPNPTTKGDAPPNPKLHGDNPPPKPPLWDAERGRQPE